MKRILNLVALLWVATLAAQTPNPERSEVFRDDIIPKVNITIAPSNLNAILAAGNAFSNTEYTARFVFDNGTIKDTLENIGFRLRGNTSRVSAKKSFKISFNTFESGRKYYGLEKMNLNGEHNDPTISRAKVAWEILRKMDMPAPRANHVELYINGEYKGLYINVEHIDEEYAESRFGNKNGNLYKCLYPADLTYKSDDPNSYKYEQNGRRVYQLKTNTEQDDYSDIANFITILNNTPSNQLPCELEKYFNVNDYLQYMAFDILTGNWDGPLYNKNNFYLYHNKWTGMLEYIPYDLDNSFGIDWFGIDWAQRNIYTWGNTSEPRPLFDKIIAVPAYKDRFSFYMNQIITNIFRPNVISPLIDNIKSKISTSAQSDQYRTLDYGYSFADFNNSFNNALGQHVKYGLKKYALDRFLSTQNQLNLNEIAPIIIDINNHRARLGSDVMISARILDEATPTEVSLFHRINGAAESNTTMNDEGIDGDTLANDGVYTATIAGLDDFGTLSYYVSAKDVNNQTSRYPSCQAFNISFSKNDIGLYINEFIASNENGLSDENGEYEDWIELFNASQNTIDLGDKFLSDDLSDNTKWQMPDIQLAPGQFILFWADNDTEQGERHTNFKLSKGGEDIVLFDANGQILDFISYSEQNTDISTGRLPNGTGDFQILNHASPEQSNDSTPVSEWEQLGYNLHISPNPSHDFLSIDFGKNSTESYTVSLLNLLGQELYVLGETIKNQQIHRFSIPSSLGSGLYFISIKNKEKPLASARIVVLK